MDLTPERRAELFKGTKEAVGPLIEDLAYLRDCVAIANVGRGELRRLSAVLRRLLIDGRGDLRDIAAPRIGRINFVAPDLKSIYRLDRSEPLAFFASGGVSVFGVFVAATMVNEGRRAPRIDDYHPDTRIEMNFDTFLNQKILCLKGEWLTRAQAIKYIANIASGVHSGSDKPNFENPAALAKKFAKHVHSCSKTGYLL